MLRNLIFIMTISANFSCFLPSARAFVLINGLHEARLDVSVEQPIVTFQWNGSAPSISSKDKFAGGIYAAMDDKDFFQALLFHAMGIWNNVRGSYIQLQIELDEQISLNSDDEVHAIVVESDKSLTSAAMAMPNIDGDRVKDCDIKIIDRKIEAKLLAYTIAHELGHCLGLGHSHTSYQSLMGYSRTKYDLSLAVDDKAGLIYLYPDPAYVEHGPKEVISCGSIAGRQTSASGAANGFGLLLILLPGFFYIRRHLVR